MLFYILYFIYSFMPYVSQTSCLLCIDFSSLCTITNPILLSPFCCPVVLWIQSVFLFLPAICIPHVCFCTRKRLYLPHICHIARSFKSCFEFWHLIPLFCYQGITATSVLCSLVLYTTRRDSSRVPVFTTCSVLHVVYRL